MTAIETVRLEDVKPLPVTVPAIDFLDAWKRIIGEHQAAGHGHSRQAAASLAAKRHPVLHDLVIETALRDQRVRESKRR